LLLAKTHVWLHDKTKLTFDEIVKAGVAFSSNSSEFLKAGIQLLENTPEQIYQAVAEMDDRINNTISDSPTQNDQLDRFWQNYRMGLGFQGEKLHGDFVAKYLRSEISATI
jgi:putative glycosyltransferase (TIGR04372 family)